MLVLFMAGYHLFLILRLLHLALAQVSLLLSEPLLLLLLLYVEGLRLATALLLDLLLGLLVISALKRLVGLLVI